MTESQSHQLEVPGAVLHYDVWPAETATNRPTLVMFGSPMDARGFASLMRHFRDRTVVTYDPRGTARSERTNGSGESTAVTSAGSSA